MRTGAVLLCCLLCLLTINMHSIAGVHSEDAASESVVQPDEALQPENGAGTAVIYIYRIPKMQASVYDLSFHVDGVLVGEIGNKKYARLELGSGIHSIAGDILEQGIKKDFEAGKEYYFNIHFWAFNRSIVTYMPYEMGKYEFESIKRKKLTKDLELDGMVVAREYSDVSITPWGYDP